ncbi:UNVERIFIED_CONTAM: G-type lectin S-receptor-like serine/threonine-protein kinase [Sesamum radiatum]|uniref:G-type lectin S-receptor-like serine/threonine-protein kinase n=1 Tax=Sesamum radiatum TaxID=300843 RepID=A0AAW2KJ27_SESRA
MVIRLFPRPASFELGFFRPGNSTNLYVGIWYKNVTLRTPIWVANREFPVRNTSSAALKFIQTGNLVLQDENGTIWSSNVTRAAQNPVAQLLDSGNLVIREANDYRPGNYLWQSFDHPTNTFLQGMDFGWNFVTGIERYVSSWKSNDDPARGDFTFRLDITGYPQVVIKRGDSLLHRLGPWNGMRFSGTPSVRQNPTFTAGLYMNSSVIYYREDALDRSVVSRFSLSPSGAGQRLTWVERAKNGLFTITYLQTYVMIMDYVVHMEVAVLELLQLVAVWTDLCLKTNKLGLDPTGRVGAYEGLP